MKIKYSKIRKIRHDCDEPLAADWQLAVERSQANVVGRLLAYQLPTMFVRCLLLALLLALGKAEHHVRCQTTQGDLLIELFPEVAPLGVARFRAMVGAGFYREVGFTRNIEGFLTQFGVQAGGAENDAFGDAIKDDPPCKEGAIKRGVLSFAGSGPHTRSNQLWFGYCGSAVCPGSDGLGKQPWETPLGRLVGAQSYRTLASIEANGKAVQAASGDVDIRQLKADKQGQYLKAFPGLDHFHGCAPAELDESAAAAAGREADAAVAEHAAKIKAARTAAEKKKQEKQEAARLRKERKAQAAQKTAKWAGADQMFDAHLARLRGETPKGKAGTAASNKSKSKKKKKKKKKGKKKKKKKKKVGIRKEL